MSVEIKTYAPYTNYVVDDTDPNSDIYYLMKEALAEGASCCEVIVDGKSNIVIGEPNFDYVTHRVGSGGLPYLPEINFKQFWVEEPVDENTSDSNIDFTFPIAKTMDDYLSSLSRKNRSNVKRHLRNAEALTFELKDYADYEVSDLLKMVRVKDTRSNPVDLPAVEQLLVSLKHKQTLFYEIHEGNTFIGYNLGFIHKGVYYDAIFLQAGDYSDKASDIIAKMISLLVGNIHTYSLGAGSFYKKKFVPENAQLTQTYVKYNTNFFFDVELVFIQNYCYVIDVNTKYYGVVHCDENGGYFYNDNAHGSNKELSDLIKKVFPLATYKYFEAPPIFLKGCYNESLHNAKYVDPKTGLRYLKGFTSYKNVYDHYLNLDDEIFRTHMKVLPDPEKVKSLYLDHFKDDLFLLEVGYTLDEPDYEKVFGVTNHCLRWYPTKEEFVKSFKSKRRKEVSEIYEKRGTVKPIDSSVLTKHYDTLYSNCYRKYGDLFSADTLFMLYGKPNVTTLGHYIDDVLIGIFTLEKLDDVYWAYQGYLALGDTQLTKQGLLACAEYVYSIDPNSILNLTSADDYNACSYSTYKKSVSNHENFAYAYTISHNKIKEPYYKV